MLSRMKSVARRLFPGKGKGPTFRRGDVFLVSYPKSGNTWMRFLLANYIYGGDIDISRVTALLPDVHYNPQDIEKAPSPRIIKSHEPFNPKYRKVVYLVRDVRDVAVSYFYHLKKFKSLAEGTAFSDYLDSFMDGNLDNYGAWDKHVDGWLNGAEDLLLIRYEDMLENTEHCLAQVIAFCGLELDEARLSHAVAACSLGKLREVEKKEFNHSELLSSSDASINFFRKGQSGDWKGHFNQGDLDKLESKFSKTMARLGFNWS